MRSFGGSVSCHSVLHEHTTFTLSFPAKNIDVGTIFKQESGNVSYHPFPHHDNGKAEDPRLKSKSLTSHNILVVDDKEVQRTLVNLYLKQLGYSVILANNGKVAIEIIQISYFICYFYIGSNKSLDSNKISKNSNSVLGEKR